MVEVAAAAREDTSEEADADAAAASVPVTMSTVGVEGDDVSDESEAGDVAAKTSDSWCEEGVNETDGSGWDGEADD